MERQIILQKEKTALLVPKKEDVKCGMGINNPKINQF